jgi:hypothetical protein
MVGVNTLWKARSLGSDVSLGPANPLASGCKNFFYFVTAVPGNKLERFYGAKTLNITRLSVTTLSITTLSITTLSITRYSIMGLFATLSINNTQYKQHSA